MADTFTGKATARLSELNDFDVLDNWVKLDGKPEMHMSLRLVADVDDTEAELVLVRLPTMFDDDSKRDAGIVKKNVAALAQPLQGALDLGGPWRTDRWK